MTKSFFELRLRSISLFAFALFLIAACGDTGSEDPDDTGTSTESSESQDYEVSDDLGDRLKTDESSDSSSDDESGDETKSQGLTRRQPQNSSSSELQLAIDSLARLEPPSIASGDAVKATSLTIDGADQLYVGYLVVGDNFGGGIDVLDAGDPTNLSAATSFKSDELDVQDVNVGNDESIYVAEAKPPMLEDGAASRVTRLDDSVGNLQESHHRLGSGNVAKGVVGEPNQTENDFYAVTDENTLYRLKNNLKENTTTEDTVGSDVDFTSVAANSYGLYALTVDGAIYSSDFADGSSLSEVINLDSGIDELGIGRLYSHAENAASRLQDDRLFAALGTEGFAVLDGSDGSEVIFEHKPDSDVYYTSVTLHGRVPLNSGQTDLVYAATRQGIIEVYEVDKNGIIAGDDSTGLTLVNRVYVHESFDTAQANYVLGTKDETKVYIAGGQEGTLILDVSELTGERPIQKVAFCTKEDNFDTDDVDAYAEETSNGETTEISWESDTKLSRVVVIDGTQLFNHTGGESGTVPSSEGADPGSMGQTPRKPCLPDEDKVTTVTSFPDPPEDGDDDDDDGDDDDDDGDDDGNGNGNSGKGKGNNGKGKGGN